VRRAYASTQCMQEQTDTCRGRAPPAGCFQVACMDCQQVTDCCQHHAALTPSRARCGLQLPLPPCQILECALLLFLDPAFTQLLSTACATAALWRPIRNQQLLYLLLLLLHRCCLWSRRCKDGAGAAGKQMVRSNQLSGGRRCQKRLVKGHPAPTPATGSTHTLPPEHKQPSGCGFDGPSWLPTGPSPPHRPLPVHKEQYMLSYFLQEMTGPKTPRTKQAERGMWTHKPCCTAAAAAPQQLRGPCRGRRARLESTARSWLCRLGCVIMCEDVCEGRAGHTTHTGWAALPCGRAQPAARLLSKHA